MRKRCLWLVPFAALLGGCALPADDDGEPPVSETAQDVTTGRCHTTKGSTTARLKVMTINLRNKENEWERRFELIADEIDRLDPDIIGLQEVEIAKDQSDRLNDLLER